MGISVNVLRDKNQTGREMHRIINLYHGDLRNVYVIKGFNEIPFSDLDVYDAFDNVRKIPYRQDIEPIEVVSRPLYIFENCMLGMDCKKKSILLSSWAKLNGIPYRLIASSNLPTGRIHHVFPQIFISGQWYNYDATYRNCRPFSNKTVTRAEII